MEKETKITEPTSGNAGWHRNFIVDTRAVIAALKESNYDRKILFELETHLEKFICRTAPERNIENFYIFITMEYILHCINTIPGPLRNEGSKYKLLSVKKWKAFIKKERWRINQ